MTDLEQSLTESLARAGVPARPVVVPTRWDVGPVHAYLFPAPPVTLIDSGVDTPEGRDALTSALGAEGLRPSDVDRVIITHAHTDHFGGSVWLQEISGCTVYCHPADIATVSARSWSDSIRDLFRPLGFSEEQLARYHGRDWKIRTPAFTPLAGGVIDSGARQLVIEHQPGHSSGHLWVTDVESGAMFVGDYLIADHPTNAGLEIDESRPTGRAPLLQEYERGLRVLAERDAPVLFPGHGPAITGHRDLIARRLARSERRTRRVHAGLKSAGPCTLLELGTRLYRGRSLENWEVISDLAGRLDQLVASGRASARMGEDGAWRFQAVE